ncbi:MAG: hypothetical protein IJ368_04930 [Oscillospiraceae bacterium]|nr:hypothetical protein [Oscillospiraceae bacterium]
MQTVSEIQALLAVLTHLMRSVPLLGLVVLACGSHGLYERMRTAHNAPIAEGTTDTETPLFP